MDKQIKEKASAQNSRRNFVKAVATAAVGFTIIPRHCLGGPGYTAPSDLLNIAAIGVGGEEEITSPVSAIRILLMHPQTESNQLQKRHKSHIRLRISMPCAMWILHRQPQP